MRNLSRFLLVPLALGLVLVLATQVGAIPTLVSFTSYVFGAPTGETAAEPADQPVGYSNDTEERGPGPREMPDIPFDEWFPRDAAETVEQAPGTPPVRIPDYEREKFGKAWADVDKNGCDTRNDILARDLSNITMDGPCTVLSGVLADLYTGKSIEFKRGPKTSSAVHIDHVVPLSWSWKAGSWKWTDEQRLIFANDPLNLMASDGPTNSSKGDKGPASWLPPNESFHCQYVIRFSAVVSKYALSLTDDDRSAIASTLDNCA